MPLRRLVIPERLNKIGMDVAVSKCYSKDMKYNLNLRKQPKDGTRFYYAESLGQILSRLFPALERIVYSTCSINQIENEDVVKSVLPIAESYGFQLAKSFPEWHVLVFKFLKAV
ncbi:hypothetical protein RYX36_030971 [Vicia faba]